MTIGVIVAAGEGNELFSDALLGCIAEVRVEQFLDKPTEFGIRFEEDIAGGQPRLLRSAELQAGKMITIAAPAVDGFKCLVRGPVTDANSTIKLGGAGSSFDIRGQDRRVELDRRVTQLVWEGRGSDCATAILAHYGFEPRVENTTRVYDERTGTLNQQGTDLAFLRRIMKRNNLCFWLTYRCELSGLDLFRRRLRVAEIANFRSSPDRGAKKTLAAANVLKLAGDAIPTLRVNVDPSQCQNVSNFEIDTSAERPTAHTGNALSQRDVEIRRTSTVDVQPTIDTDGLGLSTVGPKNRQIFVSSPGDDQELAPRAQAALTDAGWFQTAKASTTAHMLGGVLAPHDVIRVEGLGARHGGAYQVKSVTHVINGADHKMDIRLRRNSMGRD